jgi:hypothetical protein
MNVSWMIWIPTAFCRGKRTTLSFAGEYLGKKGSRFREAIRQAIIEGDPDVYAAFAKLPDASSRIFTTWRPHSIQMKVGAILELIAIDQPASIVAWPTLVGHVVRPALSPKACSRRYW